MPKASTADVNRPRAILRIDRSLRPIESMCALASSLSIAIRPGAHQQRLRDERPKCRHICSVLTLLFNLLCIALMAVNNGYLAVCEFS